MTIRPFSTLALALAGCLPLGLAAPAGAQVGRFDGGGIVYNFSAGCRAAGWSETTSQYIVRYQPAGLGNNGTRETIAFNNVGHSISYVRRDGPFGTTLTDVDNGGSYAHPFYNAVGSPNASQIRYLLRSPATLTPTLATPVRIRGQIRNWGGTEGCNVLFEVTVAQRL